jgi:glycosyltransferase involved in cell wall biosynthesis
MSVDRLPISTSIITRNEETNLRRCLESVRDLSSEIVIVDSGSTDRTEAVASEFGATFIHSDWPGFIAQKNKALALCSQPWVLCLDADEVLTPELAESIRTTLQRDDSRSAGFWLNRRTWYLGQWIWHAWYPEWRLRLLRRGHGQWTGYDPHDRLEAQGATHRLSGDLLHYSFRDLRDHLQRTIRYAQIAAESYAALGRRFRWHKLLLSPWIALFKHLLLKQGFRDGWRGWLISIIRGIDVFAKYAFLLEKERSGKSRAAKSNPGSSGGPLPQPTDGNRH